VCRPVSTRKPGTTPSACSSARRVRAQTVAELRGYAWLDACCALVSNPVIALAERLHLHAFVLDAAHIVKLVERRLVCTADFSLHLRNT
jgi:hypothetical protein